MTEVRNDRRFAPVFVLFIVILSIAMTSCSRETSNIKIGAITALSGPIAAPGGWIRDGIVLAQEEINTAGGMDGRQVEVLIEDDKCNPQDAVTSFEKLTQTQGVKAIVGPFCSGSVLSTASHAESDKVVLLTPGGAHPAISKAGDFVFRIIPSDVKQAQVLADHISSKGIETVAVLVANSEQPIGMQEAFSKAFKGKVVVVEKFEDGTDPATQVAKINGMDFQALVVFTYPQNYPSITKRVVESGLAVRLKWPIYATHTFETPTAMTLGKDGEMYEYSIQSFDSKSPQAQEFVKAYTAKYGFAPSVWAAFSYDATKILANAASRCADSKCIKNSLYSTQGYPGASGIVSFDEHGDIKEGTYAFKHVRDGKFEEIPA